MSATAWERLTNCSAMVLISSTVVVAWETAAEIGFANRAYPPDELEARVLEIHTIKPLDEVAIRAAAAETGAIVTAGIDVGSVSSQAVVLLDEVEKAHPDVFNILLQVMDHGTLTDNNGRKADFRNVVLVMTTNAGAQEMSRASIGFTTWSTSVVRDDRFVRPLETSPSTVWSKSPASR